MTGSHLASTTGVGRESKDWSGSLPGGFEKSAPFFSARWLSVDSYVRVTFLRVMATSSSEAM